MKFKKQLKARAKASLVRSNLRLEKRLWDMSNELFKDDALMSKLEGIMGGFPIRSFLPYSFL